MKFGIRKPSIKKSLRARTTGKLKRQAKKAIIPGYGKKGMGWIKNPKKAAYNKLYSHTSKSIFDLGSKKKQSSNTPNRYHNTTKSSGKGSRTVFSENIGCTSMIAGLILIIYGLFNLQHIFVYLVVGIVLIGFALYKSNINGKQKAIDHQNRMNELAPFLKELFPNVPEREYINLSDDKIDLEALNYIQKKMNDIDFAVKRMQLTSDPSEFFQRRKSITDASADLEFANSFMDIVDPSNLDNKKTHGYLSSEVEINFIKTNYFATIESSKKLKTERGKTNRINKFIEGLRSDKLPWSSEAIEYINRLTAENASPQLPLDA